MIFNKNKIKNQEEIEEIYKKKIEELDKQFLENTKNLQEKQSRGELEKEYKMPAIIIYCQIT